jgi:DNA polymerase III epsilon subunit-like protein
MESHAPYGGVQLRLPEMGAGASSYSVFDLETTGFSHRTCQIIEIGWCVVREGITQPPRSVLVACDSPLPGEIVRLTGITDEMLIADGVCLSEALRTFLDDTRGLLLVGHNVLRFDMPFLEAACSQVGVIPPSRPRYRDTAALYKAHRLGMRPRPNQDHWSFAFQALDRAAPGVKYSLPVCCEQLSIPFDGITRHRAAGDVTLTQRLYDRLLATLAG